MIMTDKVFQPIPPCKKTGKIPAQHKKKVLTYKKKGTRIKTKTKKIKKFNPKLKSNQLCYLI